MKLATFSVAKTIDNQAKPIIDSERTTKINARSGWTLFLILLTSVVIYKQRFSMKTRLCNIFKTATAIILTNAITESPYKVLLDSSKRKP